MSFLKMAALNLATVAFALLFLVPASTSAQTTTDKQDVLGHTPGMTQADADKVAAAQDWKCTLNSQPPAHNFEIYNCDTPAGSLVVRFAPYLANKPLARVGLFLKTADTHVNIVASISAQYGKRSNKISKESDLFEIYRWNLGNGKMLDYNENGKLIELYDAALEQANRDARQEAERAAKPIPRL